MGTIISSSDKPRSKYSRAYHTSNRNKFWKNITNKTDFKIEIMFESDSYEEVLEKEKEFITLYKRRIDGGVLSNISTGGEIGPVGRSIPMKLEQKKKLSDLKSIPLFIYDNEGNFCCECKNTQKAAQYIGVTYNAVYSCLSTKNWTNNYFVFRENKGSKLNFTFKDLDFRSPLRKNVTVEQEGVVKTFESIQAASSYLKTDRKNLKHSIKNKRLCKKHKVYFSTENQQPSL